MRKINRIIMISVSVLLSLVLITSSVLSGTFAKYVTGEKSVSSNTGTVASWGITVDVGDHLEKQYSNSESKIVVNTIGTTDVIAPGTSGSLAWFRVSGNPEVAFDIDLSGNIDIGMGFWSLQDVIDHTRDTMYSAFVGMTEAEKIEKIKKDQETEIVEAIKTALGNDKFDTLTEDQLEQKKNERAKTILFEMEQNVLLSNIVREKKEILLYDQDGKEIEYFPIIIDCVEYDMLNDEQMVERGRTCLTRTTLVKDQQGNVVLDDNENELKDTHKYFGEHAFDSVTDMISALNGNDSEWALSRVLDDQDNVPNQQIDKVYAIEWHWPYSNTSDYPGKGSGSAGTYQTKELDGQLGEATLKAPDMFNITLDMGVAIEQVQGKQYESFTEDGVKKIKFGSYPQSRVDDETLKNTLTAKAGTLPTTENSQNWTSYGYFTDKTDDENFMWYIDVENDGDKYRGVYFTYERPLCDEIIPGVTMKYYQSGRGYSTGTVYWFKYDPIVWTILEEASNGTAFIFCDMIVDGQAYQDEATSEPSEKWYNTSEGVPSGIYANNYEYSTIRKWLNETFYNTAFSDLQKKFIVTTVVDNRLETTPYTPGGSSEPERYVCNNTRDNIFLLSYQEAENADYNVAHIRSVTEYAKSQGTWADTTTGYGYWKLRSFYCNEAGDYWYNSWYSQYYMNNGTLTKGYVQMNFIGIVPALWIKL